MTDEFKIALILASMIFLTMAWIHDRRMSR